MEAPLLRLSWTDPVTGRSGHLVIDRLIGGLCGGGTRMRDGCSLLEVERLARAMTLKNGGLDLPVGGAKCGLDIDPHDPRAEGVLLRFVSTMRPIFETYMATGEDMGTTAAGLARVFAEAGFDSFAAPLRASPNPASEAERIRQAFTSTVEGIPLFDLVGGYGVAAATEAALRHLGRRVSGARVAIQGFGSMGGSAARYLAEKGARIVAVADALGTIVNPDGLEVERLIGSRSSLGEIDRSSLRSTDQELPREAWLGQEADVLVPAAIADAINERNCGEVRAALVVEAANIPTTAGAERSLHERGVIVLPDFIANAGTNGWAWWVLLGQVEPGPQAAFAKIATTMGETVTAMLTLAGERDMTPRQAAEMVALAKSDGHAARLAASNPA